MALARSASGPGGLSINTNSANSLFGSSTATTPAAGMFGSTQPATGGGLFGNAAKTSAPATGGLFGSTTSGTGGLFGSTPATSQPQTGGLFGSTATSQPQTGGLFGSTTTSAPATAGLFGSTTPAAGGLFGSTPATSQPQTGGLFGSTATSQPQTGGLFGSTTTNQPQQTSSLFGAKPAQNSNAVTGGGLFGNTQNQNKPATSTLFGNLGGAQNQQTQQPQQQQSTLFGGLGQSQQQQQSGNMFSNTLPSLGQTNRNQTVPGVRIDMSNIRSTTRFNDLHESLQKDIENMDNIIQAQIQLKNECDAIMPAHGQQLAAVVPSVEYVQRKSAGVDDALEIDAQAIAQVRNLVKTDAEAAKLSFRVIDNLKLPPQYHNNGIWSGKQTNADSRATNNDEEAQDLVGFFSKTADELSATLEKYQKNITEIELHLRGVEATSGQQLSAMIARRNGSFSGQENPIQELAETLTAFEQSILGVAGKVGETREGVQKLQLGDFLTGPGNVKTNGKRGGVY